MTDSLPTTFSGWEIEIRERLTDLDSPFSRYVQGKYIRFHPRINLDGDKIGGLYFVRSTSLSGEDDKGRLVFLGEDTETYCKKVVAGEEVTVAVTNNRGSVDGRIELSWNQFGPSTKYKIGLTIYATITPGVAHYTGRDCTNSSISRFTPCYIDFTTDDGTSLDVTTYAPEIDGNPNSEFPIILDANTDIIDFHSEYPGKSIQCDFKLFGKRIVLDKVILSKKEFNS